MKIYTCFILSLIFIPASIFAAITGVGSYADPYSGTITNPADNFTISGTKYYNSIIVSGGTLTISPGSILYGKTTTSFISVSGTGALNANGDPGINNITFSADNDGNGIHNSGEIWGHLFFDSSLGNSVIDNCIIEYGSKTGTGIEGYGGGIHANTNNLAISNSTFRHNYAQWGGALFVNKNRNPSITNCYIYDNSSIHGGGGFYFWDGASSVVSNCIFDSNKCLESSRPNYTGGGLATQTGCSVKIINCTFVNNTSTQPTGQSIMLYSSVADEVKNCIVWGSTGNHFYQTGGSVSYCAVQGSAPAGIGNIILSSFNSDATGPNFTNPAISDWSIKFISICRDAGTPISPAIPYDYIGNPRIGPYDIGALDVQYHRWLSNASSPTSWLTAGNWEQGLYPGLAGTTGDVIIPNLIDAAYAPNILGTTTIAAGKFMILEPGAKATFGTLTNNGTLKLNSSYAYLNYAPASLIINTYTKGGGATEEIQLPLEGGGKKSPVTYKWHYISSPVTSLPVSTFAPTYTLNVAQWVENRPITSLTQGWVAYDGYIYSGGTGGETFSNLTPGKGYNFFDTQDNIFTFSGQLNTGDVNATLSYTTGDDLLYGYNLIGNPFTSGLDWDYIIANSFPLNTTKSLYFTRWSALCTYINGVGVPGDVNGIIPPMQGFFSKTYSAGNTIVLAAAARTHNNIHPTYKGSKGLIPLVRLALTDDTLSDEMVVRFDDNAKSYLDNDFDAVKLFMDPDLSTIYSSLGGTDYAINGLPFPESILEVPVNVNLVTEATSKTITASQLQGLENYTVTLTDLSTGFIANLKTTPSVTFAAAKGTITDRFILKVSLITTDIETPAATNNKFNIYSGNNSINIQTIADEWDGHTGDVRVLDLTGKIISDLRNTEFSKNSLTQVAAPVAKGLYVVEIRAGVMRYVGKVVVR